MASPLVARLRRFADFYRGQGWRARATIVPALTEAADTIIALEIEIDILRKQLAKKGAA